jgi:apolipoprotein N-acyltransferase
MQEDKEDKGRSGDVSKLVVYATDVIIVLLSATLLSIPAESGNLWAFSFIALVPLLLRMRDRSYWAIFLMAFFTFFLYFLLALEWIDSYGIHWRFTMVFMKAFLYSPAFVISFWLKRKYNSHFYATILPALITLIEYKQTLGFFAFPWMLLCHTQHANLPLIQICSITGSFGISFLIIYINSSMGEIITGRHKPEIFKLAIGPALLVIFAGLYGAVTLSHPVPEGDIDVILAQGSESTQRQWSGDYTQRALNNYRRVTADEIGAEIYGGDSGAEPDAERLIIWPETSIPDAFTRRDIRLQIVDLARRLNSTIITGCMTYFPGESEVFSEDSVSSDEVDYDKYNSLVAFEPDGTIVPMYSKVHLVAFGEVIPLKDLITDWFPEYPWGDTDISPGTGWYVTDTSIGKIGSVICYESIFPQLTRIPVKDGAEILVGASNTSWFLRTRASYQHGYMDVFRAIENRIWFCRAATTGVSSVIDPQGRVIVNSDLFVEEALTAKVGLRNGMTFYTRYGDWPVVLCGAYIMIIMLGVFLVREGEG